MKLLPETFDRYRLTDRLDYEGEALYDYINGGAELYLSYGLAGMTGCKYNGDGLPQVTVEIYEMTSAANAFGVYTQSRDREEYEYGQGSQRSGDFLLFWKDRYYVIITAGKAVPESEKALCYTASLIDKAIPGTGRRPAIVDALPQKGLVPGGYLYFHHYIWLNAYLFIADYNLVHIGDETDAVLAKYGPADARAYLLMIDYPADADAESAREQLKKEFAPESAGERPVLRLEDGTWFTTWTRGKRLCAVFDARSSEQIDDLYHAIE
jgi:FAD/FMN-containing dehydrogenase